MSRVIEATGKPCAVCPWRTANQGQPHPGGWYTRANLRRLWSKLRRGDMMTCHATDPTNPVPDGYRAVPAGTTTRECTGALIVQQREVMRLQAHLEAGGTIGSYRRASPMGLTKAGAIEIVGNALITYPGQTQRIKPDLNTPGVGHPDLTWDYPTEAARGSH